jgi:hypothetical protein
MRRARFPKRRLGLRIGPSGDKITPVRDKEFKSNF